MRDFDNPESFQKALREELEKRGYEEELITELVEELTPVCEASSEEGDDYALAGPSAKWVIRNEHINILNDIITGGGVWRILKDLPLPLDPVSSAITSAIIGVAVATIRAIARFRRKIIYLTERQAQVVLTLKQFSNPLTVQELTKELNLVFNRPIDNQTEWDEGKTDETLRSLEKVKTESGDTEFIVSCNEQGKWRVVGI